MALGFNGVVTDPNGLSTTFGASALRVSVEIGISGVENNVNYDINNDISSPSTSIGGLNM